MRYIGRGLGVLQQQEKKRTWMRFLPSGLVTSGCSFGVVKV